MTLVIDASVVLAYLLPDEHSPAAERLLASLGPRPARVPTLWEYEVVSGLRAAERSGRIAPGDVDLALQAVAQLPVRGERPSFDLALQLSRRHELSTYDAAYLAVAKRNALALASWDARLARAAEREGIDVIKG